MPYAARTLGVNFSQVFPQIDGVMPFASVDASCTGKRLGIFQPAPVRREYPAFTQTNMQLGLDYKAWTINVYVNNVGDVRGRLNGGIGYAQNPAEFVIIQPRTVGLSATGKFASGGDEWVQC